MPVRNIVYIGHDETILKDIAAYVGTALNHSSTVKFSSGKGALLECLGVYNPNLIILDSIEVHETLEKELKLVKSNSRFKSVAIVVLCKDQEEVRQRRHLLTLGVVAFFVKGADLETFLKDCFYFAYDQKIKMAHFATAKNLSIKTKIGICSTVCAVSPDSFIIETDVVFNSESVRIQEVPFYDHPGLEFPIIQKFPSSVTYPVFESYELAYPYVGPWDELTTETIPKEAVETWIDLCKDLFEAPRPSVCVFTKSFDLISVSALNACGELDILLFDTISESNCYTLDVKKPSLILLDLGAEDSFNSYESLVSTIHSAAGYDPILIFLRAPSSSEALKKLYGYDRLIATNCSLTDDIFLKLLHKYSSHSRVTERTFLEMRLSERTRAVSVLGEIQLTSLSEHEITFTSELEIPLFASIELSLPIPLTVVVIPPLVEIKKYSGRTHYMGLIHGLSEGELTKLRKIVNQIIYQPVKEFTEELVLQLLKQMPLVPLIQKEELEVPGDLSPLAAEPSAPSNIINTRSSKSKL